MNVKNNLDCIIGPKINSKPSREVNLSKIFSFWATQLWLVLYFVLSDLMKISIDLSTMNMSALLSIGNPKWVIVCILSDHITWSYKKLVGFFPISESQCVDLKVVDLNLLKWPTLSWTIDTQGIWTEHFNFYSDCPEQNFYRLRSRGDNTFGSVRVFVCLFVCLFVRALLFEPLDLWPSYLAWWLTLTQARLGL